MIFFTIHQNQTSVLDTHQNTGTKQETYMLIKTESLIYVWLYKPSFTDKHASGDKSAS